MKFSTLLLLCFLICSCAPSNKEEVKQKLVFEPFNFQIESFDWIPDPYKFPKYIQDSITVNKGHYYAAWEYAYIGDVENLHKVWDTSMKPRDTLSPAELENFKTYKEVDAHAFIVDKAKDKLVTIINEAHHMPQHRVFTTSLLQDLYEHGYRHLGMEGYFNSPQSDSTLAANQYPNMKHGIYTKDPQFGNMIREAMKIGYSIFGYESQGHEDSKGREINQAKNIQQYMIDHPEGNYLIHCGFDHGYEGVIGGKWGKAMAGRLTEFTQIDPLTINQTAHSERSQKAFEDKYYRELNVKVPTVLIKEDSIFGKYRADGWFDISVFHPRTKNFDRAEWLLIGDRKVVNVDFSDAPIDCPCLAFAYVGGEELGVAVPYDIQYVETTNVNLVLDKDDYEVVLWSHNMEAVKTVVSN